MFLYIHHVGATMETVASIGRVATGVRITAKTRHRSAGITPKAGGLGFFCFCFCFVFLLLRSMIPPSFGLHFFGS